MSPDRLLQLLLADSPRWLGEATFHLLTARQWLERGRNLLESDSPLIQFYRCIHGFKGACSLMSSRVPLAERIAWILHEMEGPLALKDRWSEAAAWIPRFEAQLAEIRQALHDARLESLRSGSQAGPAADSEPQAVKASSGGRELTFPWSSVVEFLTREAVQGRPFVSVQGRLVAVVPSTGGAHEGVFAGIVVRTQSQQMIAVPVQKLEMVYDSAPQVGAPTDAPAQNAVTSAASRPKSA